MNLPPRCRRLRDRSGRTDWLRPARIACARACAWRHSCGHVACRSWQRRRLWLSGRPSSGTARAHGLSLGLWRLWLPGRPSSATARAHGLSLGLWWLLVLGRPFLGTAPAPAVGGRLWPCAPRAQPPAHSLASCAQRRPRCCSAACVEAATCRLEFCRSGGKTGKGVIVFYLTTFLLQRGVVKYKKTRKYI